MSPLSHFQITLDFRSVKYTFTPKEKLTKEMIQEKDFKKLLYYFCFPQTT